MCPTLSLCCQTAQQLLAGSWSLLQRTSPGYQRYLQYKFGVNLYIQYSHEFMRRLVLLAGCTPSQDGIAAGK